MEKLDSYFADLRTEFAGLFDPEKLKQNEYKRRQREREKDGVRFIPMSAEEKRHRRKEQCNAREAKQKEHDLLHIAVLDFETDPFDEKLRERIAPFTACLYSDQFEPVVIWDDDENRFVQKVISAVECLPGEFTVYAHNGGKFDFMFLIHKLRGSVSFKGRAIMEAKIGQHRLRDSFHLIPEKLAAFQKDKFDYSKLTKRKRHLHRDEIIRYMVNDCRYLFDIVSAFVRRYGLKISIGQCALMLLRREYPEFETIREHTDTFLRNFFYGGRVECFQGRGEFHGDYKLYDVNSMYPFVMVGKSHPIGSSYVPRAGEPNENTCFIRLFCRSFGAFPFKEPGKGTLFPIGEYRRFHITIHEYATALKYNLIDRVRIEYCVDNELKTDFSKFILPLYENRIFTKNELERLKQAGLENTGEYLDIKKDDIFYKLLMNNAYGKTCQNPRRFKEHWLTDWDERPETEPETWGIAPEFQGNEYAIWSRPNPRIRFLNVGTGASITGAARAMLLEAKQNAIDPIYCDTDSIICRELINVPIDKTQLGAWDIEARMNHVCIAGKKLYAYNGPELKEPKIRAKGVAGVTFENVRDLANGSLREMIVSAKAPTLTRKGEQSYIDRTIRSTVAPRSRITR